MSTLAVVGAQWGDEGKGKVVDVLAAEADLVARYSGGNNAGHTLVIEGRKIVTHLVPSGCTYPGTLCVLGTGMVIDPVVLREEVEELQRGGLLLGDELRVSLDAHVIFPFHRILDGLREDAAAARGAIGTTRRGIGPAYEAKAARRGIRIRDLFKTEALREKLRVNRELVGPELERLGHPGALEVDELERLADSWTAWLRPLVCDASGLVFDAIDAGQRVLFEGAQGAMLDLDHGTYPYVTSANTISGGVCTGLGIGPTAVDASWGITKAYVTRVGNGPFPTRLDGEVGERLRSAGSEFGATTGRPRDCGWLDIPALRLACRKNGLSGLCMTKLDVLAALPDARLCLRYRDGLDPGRDGFDDAVPEFEQLAGWDTLDPAAVSAARSLEALPGPVRSFLDQVSEAVGVPMALLGVGPERSQTIRLADAFSAR